MVNPERDALAPPLTWKTRLSPPPLTVTPAVGPVIVQVGIVPVFVNSSWPPVGGIVCMLAKILGEKLLATGPANAFARLTAPARVNWAGAVLTDPPVDSTTRL